MEDVTLEQIEQLSGSVLLEFGAEWCGYCRAAQPLIQSALAEHRDVRHIKIEDGKGKRLGRQFGVKLWPSLIFVKNGKEIGRLVRPHDTEAIMQLLAKLNSPQAETDRQ